MISKRLLTLCMVGVSTLLCAGSLAAQVLYGASNGTPQRAGPSDLYTIDPDTGAATLVGPIGFDNVTGMTFLPDGRLMASARGDSFLMSSPSAILIEIDPSTGAGSYIGTIFDLNAGGDCGRMPDISFDTTSGNLYGYGDFCVGGFEGLFSVDPDTGVASSIGPSGYSGGGNGLDAEPGTGTLYATPFDSGSLVVLDPVTGAGSDVPGSAGNVPFRVNALDFNPLTGVLYGSFNEAFAAAPISHLVTIDTSDGSTTIIGETVLNLDAIAFSLAFAPATPVPMLSSNWMALLALLMAMGGWVFLHQRARRR